MRAVIDLAFSHSRTVLSTLVLLLVAGAVGYAEIPKEAEPDISIPLVIVRVMHEGISPEDAERLIIRPLEQELRSVHRSAAWALYDALWKISRQLQPEQAEDERQALIEASLAPVLDDATAPEAKILLLLRLFQTTLLTLIAPLAA